MNGKHEDYRRYVTNISNSGLSIYDPIEIGDPNLWIPTPELEKLLNDGLRGKSLDGLPLRTRSKVVKQTVCQVLGYPVPKSFKKTRPRFQGQLFDTYIQKSDNLQIWNEEISLTRRYAIIDVSVDDVIRKVKVVTGDVLASLDTTGTLTQKYQARLIAGETATELVVPSDCDHLMSVLKERGHLTRFKNSPTDQPTTETLLPISQIFERLQTLVARRFTDAGHDQERNRGAQLHRLVCEKLGYESYQDDGRFPDIRNQLLEVKLQTSPTIDLGLVRPDSQEPLDVPRIQGMQARHCDVRYAIFRADTDGTEVTLTHFYLTTGEAFFSRFPQFQGKVINKKLQIPLPGDFFDR